MVSSDGQWKPTPWTIQQSYTIGGQTHTFTPLSLHQMETPTILLSTVQHYVPAAMQQQLREIPIHIPFRRYFENQFTFGELDYISLDKGGQSTVTRQIDGRHPTERIFWFFRSWNSLERNQLDNFKNDYFDHNLPNMTQPYTEPYGEFYYSMKLVIAGKDREDSHTPLIWNTVQSSKLEKGQRLGIGNMIWSFGSQYGTQYPALRSPEGTLNLSTADRPTLYIQLANVISNPFLAQRKTEFRVYTEGWNVYEIKEGRGRLLFAH